MLELYLMRHGRTSMNRNGLLQGRGSDVPLDAEGITQAQTLGAWFLSHGIRFDCVIASPLRRARQTAALAAGVPESEVETDPLLLEMDYGPWEGYELAHHDPALEAFFADFAHAPTPPGMEPLEHVKARASAFLQSLSPKSGRVLVSTHAILLKGALEVLDSEARGSWWGRYLGNCWVYQSTWQAGKLQPAELVYGSR